MASLSEPLLRPTGDSCSASWRAEGASIDWCTLRAATATGVRHRLSAQEGEDSFAWSHRERRLTLAVADGIGSVPGSAGASRRVVVASVLAAADASEGMEALSAAIAAANSEAAGGGATTIVVAVVEHGGRVQLARVGDSTAFVVSPTGTWRELFDPPDDDRVGTETAALPFMDRELEVGERSERTETVLGEGEVLVLASDGVADPWRDGPTTVAPAITEALLECPSALDLARLVDFSRQGCHDDRTLACIWRRG